jgi:hypothetical protein
MEKSFLKKSRVLFFFVFLALLFLGIAALKLRTKSGPSVSPYPDGKNFAFTITADPDDNRLEKDKLIYDFFTEVGLRTTIAVWVKEPTRSTGVPGIPIPREKGDSCERDDYLRYMQELQKRGFEIALHTVSSGNDYRKETIKGYEKFKDYFGAYPNINIMHSTNLENVYWGKKVAEKGLIRYLIGLLADRGNIPYSGEVLQSKYFWGDILKQKTKYVRLWGTSDINTLKLNPSMPYHNPKKPYVNYWFSFSDGFNAAIFNKLISDENIKRLVNERGSCIVYTHFASGFVKKGGLDQTFKKQMEKIAQERDGWFVPASELLDRLLLMKNVTLTTSKNAFLVANLNSCVVAGVTVLVHPNEVLFNSRGISMAANEEGEIVLESLKPGETYILLRDRKFIDFKNEYPTFLEKLNMLLQRSLVYLKHNY